VSGAVKSGRLPAAISRTAGRNRQGAVVHHARDREWLSHAEEDLCLRGEGDVLGTRQSGIPGFRLALPEVHGDLLEVARDEAKLALACDPDFSSERANALRLLLYLFSATRRCG
jgi:hypothetical protein